MIRISLLETNLCQLQPLAIALQCSWDIFQQEQQHSSKTL